MKAGWRDAPLALRDSVVSNMQEILQSAIIFVKKNYCEFYCFFQKISVNLTKHWQLNIIFIILAQL